jgi:hypothetical protein
MEKDIHMEWAIHTLQVILMERDTHMEWGTLEDIRVDTQWELLLK